MAFFFSLGSFRARVVGREESMLHNSARLAMLTINEATNSDA